MPFTRPPRDLVSAEGRSQPSMDSTGDGSAMVTIFAAAADRFNTRAADPCRVGRAHVPLPVHGDTIHLNVADHRLSLQVVEPRWWDAHEYCRALRRIARCSIGGPGSISDGRSPD